MPTLQEANARVQQAVDDLIARDQETGLQVAAYLDGELAVDVWGGIADPETGRLVDGDTLFTVFSATKGVVSSALHLQAERGLVDYDAPVVRYWPEFGQHGKDRVTVRDALLHRAGVPQMPPGTTPEEMCDWDGMVQAVAALAPVWEPGTRSGYHAYTFGWIIGEIVRRTDPRGRSFSRFLREELCAPLGIDDIWLGIDDAVEPRVATIVDAPPPTPEVAAAMAARMPPLFFEAIPPHLGTNRATFGRHDVRRSCHPGAGGIMTARGLARHYALLACGGELDGGRLLAKERVAAICTLYTDEPDAVIASQYRRGLGYWLADQANPTIAPMGRNPRALGHPGAGGSLGWADPDTHLAVAIVKNRMTGASPDGNPLTLIGDAVREALGIA